MWMTECTHKLLDSLPNENPEDVVVVGCVPNPNPSKRKLVSFCIRFKLEIVKGISIWI